MTIGGVEIEFGRGWTQEEGLWVAGDEAELLVDYNGRPVGQVRLRLQAERGLAGPQVVTVRLDGRECVRASLLATESCELQVPVGPADLARSSGRLTLHFTAYRRRSAWDLRPFAAQVLAVQVGFRE